MEQEIEETRKLASVRIIDKIEPIENADAIEVATIGGWKVVVKKDEFKEGDKVIYFEIDSWIPREIAPFLCSEKPKLYKDIDGARLRTIKLRGQISQGLVIPLEDQSLEVDTNLTEEMNIIKWEPKINPQMAGQIKGTFPSFIHKTEADRIQNAKLPINEISKVDWEVTEKLHGSSCTIYIKDGEIGACSRNMDLKINEENKDNVYVKVALENEDFLKSQNRNIAIQGEVIGPKINGNMYKLNEVEFHVFKIWDIDEQRYLLPKERLELLKDSNFKHVPILDEELDFTNFETILECANGISKLFKTSREGFVLKDKNSDLSFKVISNKWLLKGKE